MAGKYTCIWKELKEKKKCAIAAPVQLHSRLIKAVTTEKYKDQAYRLKCILERKRSKIIHIVNGARIRFILREFDILSGITFAELEGNSDSFDLSETIFNIIGENIS